MRGDWGRNTRQKSLRKRVPRIIMECKIYFKRSLRDSSENTKLRLELLPADKVLVHLKE